MSSELKQSLAALRLPLICAPMFGVSYMPLVRAARQAGIVGALPRHNFPTPETFEAALAACAEAPSARNGMLAVNLSTRMSADELRAELAVCERYGVRIVITAKGNPAPVIEAAHRVGIAVFSDVTSVAHARKAAQAGADGLICICQGGGGHSGRLNHMTMLATVRDQFKGVLILAGALSTGHDLLAAQALGADLAYMGTRFIATTESGASESYKQMLVNSEATDLLFTPMVNSVPANWLKPSLEAAGVQIAVGGEHQRLSSRPWLDIWSAGQGVSTIADVPSVEELVARLEQQYLDQWRALAARAPFEWEGV